MYVSSHKIVLINGPEQEKSFNSNSYFLGRWGFLDSTLHTNTLNLIAPK